MPIGFFRFDEAPYRLRQSLLVGKEEIVWRTTISPEGIEKKLEDGDCVHPISFL